MIDRKVFIPGIYDISNQEYHDSAGISRSSIKEFAKTPRHYWNKYLNPRYIKQQQSNEMIFGSAFHCYVLEYEKFCSEYFVAENFDKRTKAGKEGYLNMIAISKGKILIERDEMDLITSMEKSIMSDPQAKELIKDAQYEASIYWVDPETQLLCKCRPDILHDNFIVDLKTTKDASPRSFQRDFYNYGYPLQLAMMHEGVKHVLGRNITNFIDLAVEKSDPYLSAIYPIDESALQFGIEQFHFYLRKMKECFDKNEWPGYKVQTISLPSYATIEDL